MDEQKIEFHDVEDVKEDSTFVEALAQYYSDFLATDFKKGSLPKRRFQTRDKKNRRSGITLEKFSSFIPVLNKSLSKNFGLNNSLIVKPKAHQTKLSGVVLAAIEAEIKRIKFAELELKNQKSVEAFKKAINKWLKPKVPEGCVVHSFRHSLRDRLSRVECPSDITDAVGGWATAGVSQKYGSGYGLEVKTKWMERILVRAPWTDNHDV